MRWRVRTRIEQNGEHFTGDEGVPIVLVLVKTPSLSLIRTNRKAVAINKGRLPMLRFAGKNLKNSTSVVDVVYGRRGRDAVDLSRQ